MNITFVAAVDQTQAITNFQKKTKDCSERVQSMKKKILMESCTSINMNKKWQTKKIINQKYMMEKYKDI